MLIVYLVGLPGAGKTTALDRAIELAGWGDPADRRKPFGHQKFFGGQIQLGSRRVGFGGTDGLSMSVNPRAIEFIVSRPSHLICGEGDRLANAKFLTVCQQMGELRLLHLDLPPSTARLRSEQRAATLGLTQQNATWWKGRLTKLENLLGQFKHERIDATREPRAVAMDVMHRLCP